MVEKDKMSRAVFVSAGGDPFLLSFVYKLFCERWYKEVDVFWVCLNNHSGTPTEVISELVGRLLSDPKVRLIYHPAGIGNGPPITQMTKVSQEDLVMLLEDDGFIFTPGIVDEYFNIIESREYDIVGSPRYTYGEVAEAAQRQYNLDYSGAGDRGFGWWPNFFFCRREDLLKTDLDFGSKEYKKGEYFKEVDYTFQETNYTDTFTWACLQLRYLGLRAFEVPQYHADPYEIDAHEKRERNWAGEPMRWIHGGSLSAGLGGYLTGKVPDVNHKVAKLEIETRVAFWIIVAEAVKGFDDFKLQYQKGINDLIYNANLVQERINKKIEIYKQLLQL